MERKIGTVYSSNPKGWVFVYVTPLERYFLHVSEIKSDRMPALGDRLTFTPAPPRNMGQLPCAIDAKPIVETVEGEKQLGGVK